MSDENVVKESAGADGRAYRVRMVEDHHAEMPYDDGSAPLWRVDYAGLGWRAEQVKMTSFDAPGAGLSDAVNRFGGPNSPLVERWLKAYHGTTVVETWHSGDAWYITADPKVWRESVGTTPEHIAAEAAKGSLMSEYQAWCHGDVYGYVIESKVSTYTVVIEPADGEIIGSRHDTEWREAEDGVVMGLYGHDWALKFAAEEFDAFLYRMDREVNASRYETVFLKES